MISEEDWGEAHQIVIDIRDASRRDPEDADSADIVNALVAAGWGPQCTVSKKAMARLMVHAWMSTQDAGDAFDAMVEAAAGAVLAAGIEVDE